MLSDVMNHFGLQKEFDQAGYFATDHHRYLIQELSAAIPKGRIIAFTGIVGSGKTKLLQQLRQNLKQENAAVVARSLAERLATALQINHYLTLALEEAYQIGQKPVSADIVGNVLSSTLNDPEPHLIRQGYQVLSLARLINAKPAEIRAFLHSQLPPVREQELKEQLLKVGVPL